MEEQVIMTGKRGKVALFLIIILTISFIISAISLISAVMRTNRYYEEQLNKYLAHLSDGECEYSYDYFYYYSSCDLCSFFTEYDSNFEYLVSIYTFDRILSYGTVFYYSLIICAFLWLWIYSYQITITNKRVYGRVFWGVHVNLPLDSISATSKIQLFGTLSISTPSGRIVCSFMSNANEMYSTINQLLIEHQNQKSA